MLDQLGIEEGSPDEKPYPNEHACRLRNPNDFQDDSFRRTSREHEGKKYSVIMGKLKGESTMTEQAYRYAKDTWKVNEARSHCKSHDGTFEAAEGESRCLIGPPLAPKRIIQVVSEARHTERRLIGLAEKALDELRGKA
jgi:hypothetical protein